MKKWIITYKFDNKINWAVYDGEDRFEAKEKLIFDKKYYNIEIIDIESYEQEFLTKNYYSIDDLKNRIVSLI